jgi:hypothetical protein
VRALEPTVTGHMDGYALRFGEAGEEVVVIPSFDGAHAALRLAREALSLLDQTLSERKTA